MNDNECCIEWYWRMNEWMIIWNWVECSIYSMESEMINEWDGLVDEWIVVSHWMLIGNTVVLDNG